MTALERVTYGYKNWPSLDKEIRTYFSTLVSLYTIYTIIFFLSKGFWEKLK